MVSKNAYRFNNNYNIIRMNLIFDKLQKNGITCLALLLKIKNYKKNNTLLINYLLRFFTSKNVVMMV